MFICRDKINKFIPLKAQLTPPLETMPHESSRWRFHGGGERPNYLLTYNLLFIYKRVKLFSTKCLKFFQANNNGN